MYHVIWIEQKEIKIESYDYRADADEAARYYVGAADAVTDIPVVGIFQNTVCLLQWFNDEGWYIKHNGKFIKGEI